MVPQENPTPDRAAIRLDLETMTRRWHELPEPAVFEVRAFAENKQPQIARFKPDWIDDAVDWIANMNAIGFNTYSTRNPIRATVTKSASDTDILAACFLWADCDDPAAAGNVYRFDGPKYTAAVTTGRVPSTRVHVYWELEDWCTDLDAWRAMQSDIAAHFKSDRAVINPSRIMRIGGTVSLPAAHKRARGYITEAATIRTAYDDGREPVRFDQMRRVFPHAIAASSAHGDGFQIDTGAIAVLDRERTAIQAQSGAEWNNSVLRLVGSYIRKGLSDGEIHALTEPLTLGGYTVEQTHREVKGMIDRTRANPKFNDAGQDEQFREMTDAEKDAVPAAMFRPWREIDLAAIPHPQFVYSDFYARGYTSLTVAAPKVGKSMLGLAEAIDAATGRGFLTGEPREPQTVVYYNAEDDQNVIDSRVAAILTAYDIPQSEIVGRFYPTSGVEEESFFMVSGVDGVINEALFIGIEKFCEESGADLLIFDPLQDLSRSPETNEVFRLLGQRLRRMASKCQVSIGLIHHTRKVAPGVTPSIDDARGGGAIRGTARFNRILVGMTEDEAANAGVENHRHYLRVGDMESNLAPPSSDVNRWFEKASEQTPNSHYVGVIKPWEWPDAFTGISKQDARRVQVAVAHLESDPPLESSRSPQRWVGVVVAETLGLDLDDKAQKSRVKNLVRTWIKNGVLEVVKVRNARAGRDVDAVIAGPNNPATEGGEQ